MNSLEVPEPIESGDVYCELIPEVNSKFGTGSVKISIHTDDPVELLCVISWLKEAVRYLKQKRWEKV